MNPLLPSIDPSRRACMAVGLSLLAHAVLLGGWWAAASSPKRLAPVVIELAAQARAPMQVQWLAAAPSRPVDRSAAAVPGSSPAKPVGGSRAMADGHRRVAAQMAAATNPRAASVAPPAAEVSAAVMPGHAAVAGAVAGAAGGPGDVRAAASATPTSSMSAAEPARAVGPQPLPGNALPGYPLAAREDGLEGRVLLRVQIDPVGAVCDVAILQRSGVNLLDQAARDAVRAWRFRPASDGREAVASSLQLAIRFSLREPAPRMELALAGIAR